jgi:molybdopterin-guanine dinucleotide biosynthesis protein A
VSWDAVILAGGQARRLGGVDKMTVTVGGRAVLDRVVDAVRGAQRIVVVGSRRPLARPVVWTREDPPGGGPVAGLAAGLGPVHADRTVLLAGDLPFVSPALVDLLLAEVGGTSAGAVDAPDGAMLADAEGVPQLLCGAWRTESLRRALAAVAVPAGTSVRRLVAGLRVRTVPPPAGGPPPWLDCDTAADLATANDLAPNDLAADELP